MRDGSREPQAWACLQPVCQTHWGLLSVFAPGAPESPPRPPPLLPHLTSQRPSARGPAPCSVASGPESRLVPFHVHSARSCHQLVLPLPPELTRPCTGKGPSPTSGGPRGCETCRRGGTPESLSQMPRVGPSTPLQRTFRGFRPTLPSESSRRQRVWLTELGTQTAQQRRGLWEALTLEADCLGSAGVPLPDPQVSVSARGARAWTSARCAPGAGPPGGRRSPRPAQCGEPLRDLLPQPRPVSPRCLPRLRMVFTFPLESWAGGSVSPASWRLGPCPPSGWEVPHASSTDWPAPGRAVHFRS